MAGKCKGKRAFDLDLAGGKVRVGLTVYFGEW